MVNFRSSAFGGTTTTPDRSSLTKTITDLYDQMAAQYQPGGTYLKGIEAQLARRKKGALASGMQSLVSSGMAGTTQAAGLGKKFEEEVGVPTMAAAETDRIGKLTSAMMGKANFMQQLLSDTPEKSFTRIMKPMSKGILTRDREKTAAKKQTSTTKPGFTTHTGRSMFKSYGPSGYGATSSANVGSQSLGDFFSKL